MAMSTTEPTPIDRTRALYEAFTQGRIDDVLDSLSEDTRWHVPGTRAHIPWAGSWRGRQGVGELFAALDEHLDIEAYEPDRFVADGDFVVASGRERVRSRATGKVHDGRWVHLWTLSGGRFTRFEEHFDTDATAAILREGD